MIFKAFNLWAVLSTCLLIKLPITDLCKFSLLKGRVKKLQNIPVWPPKISGQEVCERVWDQSTEPPPETPETDPGPFEYTCKT